MQRGGERISLSPLCLKLDQVYLATVPVRATVVAVSGAAGVMVSVPACVEFTIPDGV